MSHKLKQPCSSTCGSNLKQPVHRLVDQTYNRMSTSFMYKQAFVAILFLLEHIIIFFYPTLRVTNKLQLNKHETQVQNS